ncbi:adenylylsulfate kinase [Desarmillaria tabescens]|uniref:Adenylyl-sulfate kinase n=1 Tax=Armillaria tabescens TaxID=1929756 RepID=A0AA39NCV2_ARMTA|nr:adenylylsulfate kinase [Desarmillaria tabescens]KAK0463251.1 adenylylsulfate kinase [Desarmillaria tabescens]
MCKLTIVPSEGSVSSEERTALLGQKGVIIWLTRLSASGKSTIACALEQHLLHLHKNSYRLDGDNVRFGLNKDQEMRTSISKIFANSASITITAFISPYHIHEKALFPFVEVFVDAPLHVVEQCDPKSLYKKARAEFMGISAPYEAPENPEIHIDTLVTDVVESVRIITDSLMSKGYISV